MIRVLRWDGYTTVLAGARAIGCSFPEQIRLRLDDHTQPLRKIGWSSTNNIRTGFGGGISHFQANQAIYSQWNDGKRLYRTLNHLRDGIWSHHGQQTALLEIELSLLEFAVSTMRSVHAIEVSVVRDRISRSVS
jgi:hypothetical protein